MIQIKLSSWGGISSSVANVRYAPDKARDNKVAGLACRAIIYNPRLGQFDFIPKFDLQLN